MEYQLVLEPTVICEPVVVNVAVSLFTKPEMEPAAVRAVPS